MNTFFSPDNEYIYQLVSTYYDNPTMYFIKTENNSTLYGVQIPSLLMNSKRFLIAITDSKVSDTSSRKLRQIVWKTFQVRTLAHDNPYNSLPITNYKQKRDACFSFPLQVISRNKQITTYKSTYEFTVSLLHTKGIEYEYPNEGTFISSLETFQTIIQLS